MEELPSVQDAIYNAKDGLVVLRPGVYVEDLYINRSMHLVSDAGPNQTRIIGHIIVNASHVTLNGITVSGIDKSRPLIAVLAADYVSVLNCKLVGKSKLKSLAEEFVAPAVYCKMCSRLQLVNNVIQDWTLGVNIIRGTDIVIRSNSLSSCVTAVSVLSCSDLKLARNAFFDNALAIRIKGHAYSHTIRYNIFDNNVRVTMANQDLRGFDNLDVPVSQSIFPPSDSVRALVFSGNCSKGVGRESITSVYSGLENVLHPSICAQVLLSTPHSHGNSHKLVSSVVFSQISIISGIVNVIFVASHFQKFLISSTLRK